jgi:hypothetical protein
MMMMPGEKSGEGEKTGETIGEGEMMMMQGEKSGEGELRVGEKSERVRA